MNVSGHSVMCDTQRIRGCRVKHRARYQSCSAKVSETNLREGRYDEILVAASRRTLDQNSTRRAINELVSCRHRALVSSQSILDHASPLRRVRSDHRSGNDTPFYSTDPLLFSEHFQTTEAILLKLSVYKK